MSGKEIAKLKHSEQKTIYSNSKVWKTSYDRNRIQNKTLQAWFPNLADILIYGENTNHIFSIWACSQSILLCHFLDMTQDEMISQLFSRS